MLYQWIHATLGLVSGVFCSPRANKLHAKQCTDQLKEGHETFDDRASSNNIQAQTLFLLHSFALVD